MLESYKHPKNAFITLTYAPEHLPPGGTLVPKHFQDFLKRLRKRLSPNQVRYYGCGEYGDQTERAHYHAALFGVGPEDAEAIDSSWGLGHSLTGELTNDSAQYIAGYVTKKMTAKDDPRLEGRHPEFARMSLRPGIGASAVNDIADVLTTGPGCDALARAHDVPNHLLLERKQLPLGRYLRGKLREKMGFPDKKCPPEILDAWKTEMQELRKDAFSTSELSAYIDKTQHFKSYLIDKNAQRVLQIETKNKIFAKVKKL